MLNVEIVTVVFERGAFGVTARESTAALLRIYGFWVVPAILGAIIGKMFYSMRRWLPLLGTVLLGVVAKYVLSVWWIQSGGIIALAWATVAATVIVTGVLFAILPRWCQRNSWLSWLRLTATVSVIVVGAAMLMRVIFAADFMSSWHTVAWARLVGTVAVGGTVLWWLGPSWGIPEIMSLRMQLAKLSWLRR